MWPAGEAMQTEMARVALRTYAQAQSRLAGQEIFLDWLRPGVELLQVIAVTIWHPSSALLDVYPPDAQWSSATHYDPAVDRMPRLSAATGIRHASCYFLCRLHTGVSAAYNAAAACARHRNTGSILMIRAEHLDEEWWEFFGDNEDLAIISQSVGPAIFQGEVKARQEVW